MIGEMARPFDPSRFVAGAIVALTTLLRPAVSAGDEPAADGDAAERKRGCIAAHASTQRQRRTGAWQAARRSATQCAASACPDPLRSECSTWLSELDASMPALRFEASTSAGEPVRDAEIFVDGVRVATRVPNRAVPVDPGEHTVAAITPEGMAAKAQVSVDAGATQLVSLRFTAPAAARSPARFEPRPGPSPKAVAFRPRPRDRSTAYALLATSGAAALSGGYFAWMGLRAQRDLESRCAPRCDPGETHSMTSRYVAADVAFGVSALALGGALWILLTEPADATR